MKRKQTNRRQEPNRSLFNVYRHPKAPAEQSSPNSETRKCKCECKCDLTTRLELRSSSLVVKVWTAEWRERERVHVSCQKRINCDQKRINCWVALSWGGNRTGTERKEGDGATAVASWRSDREEEERRRREVAPEDEVMESGDERGGEKARPSCGPHGRRHSFPIHGSGTSTTTIYLFLFLFFLVSVSWISDNYITLQWQVGKITIWHDMHYTVLFWTECIGTIRLYQMLVQFVLINM